MSDALSKPDHLRPERSVLAANPAAVTTLILGVLAFAVVAMFQPTLWSTPDWRISVPAFAVTAAASIVSVARRERAYTLWMLGLGLAAAALVLGMFMMFVLVIGATAVLIAILHSVF